MPALLHGHGLSALALALALAWDRGLGEPPAVLHPVVWMGRLINAAERLAPASGPKRQLACGLLLAWLIPTLFALLALGTLRLVADWPWAWLLVSTAWLKIAFALRGLGEAARVLRDALQCEDIHAARHALRALCSRRPDTMQAPELSAATVESVAENLSDSFVAPLFYAAFFGPPGAVFYRAVNTLDAMLGYHGHYEYLGRASARLDDILNFVPSRITAGLLVLAGLPGGHARSASRILRRDGGRTESPNAGRPMAAMAGLLGVRLIKPGCYALGDAHMPVDAGAIDAAWRHARTAAYVWAMVALCIMLILGVQHG